MSKTRSAARALLRTLAQRTTLVAASGALLGGLIAFHDNDFPVHFRPGNLVVSRSVYDNKASNVTVGTILPPGCAGTTGGCSAPTGAPDNGTYPTVWTNNTYDGSFGLTSKLFLDQITPSGKFIGTLEVPSGSARDSTGPDHLVTSFSSKSEVALHLSTDGRYVTFMGYVTVPDRIDVSNSNTPGAVDPTNPVGENVYRAVAQVDRWGTFRFTKTNAYSGNNGRAAILNNSDGANVYYTAGNAGNGANPQPEGIILGAGAQIITPSDRRESAQTPGTPTPLSSFNVTQLGVKADKIGKDDNFRGIQIFNHVVYFTKGSGSNGVNTVYFVDVTGKACPKGVGVPSSTATLPTTPLAYNPVSVADSGLPSNMCILAGFPTALAKTAKVVAYPFALWFANATTLYVADEGDGYAGGADLYTHAAAQTTAGLQKWVFDTTKHVWNQAYTLKTNLGLGTAYAPYGYPTGNNPATSLPWAPATDGLRNITGRVNDDGTATIWGVTSTVSGNGDQGADPNKLVAITDLLTNTDPTVAAGEAFHAVRAARTREVLRGVSFTPGTGEHEGHDDHHDGDHDDR